jgi:hypothetical protein
MALLSTLLMALSLFCGIAWYVVSSERCRLIIVLITSLRMIPRCGVLSAGIRVKSLVLR